MFDGHQVTDAGTSRALDLGAGETLHYHDVGEGSPLLMLPAFGPIPGTSAWLTFHAVVGVLATHYRCVLLDYPNFGRSSPLEFHEPVHDVYVRVSLALLDALEIGSAMVVGTSTGGTVALDLALTAPERVDRLVVGACEASTGGDPHLLAPTPTEVARRWTECQSSPPDRGLIRQVLEAIVYDAAIVTDELVESMYALRVAEPVHAETYARSTSVPHSNIDRLATLTPPTLVVHGRSDRMVPLEAALRLLSYLPDADLVVLNRCGHWPTVERPDTFLEHVLPFLAPGERDLNSRGRSDPSS